jgi:hypothetical protein
VFFHLFLNFFPRYRIQSAAQIFAPPYSLCGGGMSFVFFFSIKDPLSVYLAGATKKKEPIVVIHHGKP